MSGFNESIRFATLRDLPEMQNMFVGTISTICKNDYSPEQINAWTFSIEDIQRWIDKLTSQYFLVASIDNKIVGFASLEKNDYLDFLYVHKDYQRQGIAGKLYDEIEKEAIKNKSKVLYADVSKSARTYFEKKGFKMLEIQTKTHRGVEIINYKMIKEL